MLLDNLTNYISWLPLTNKLLIVGCTVVITVLGLYRNRIEKPSSKYIIALLIIISLFVIYLIVSSLIVFDYIGTPLLDVKKEAL